MPYNKFKHNENIYRLQKKLYFNKFPNSYCLKTAKRKNLPYYYAL